MFRNPDPITLLVPTPHLPYDHFVPFEPKSACRRDSCESDISTGSENALRSPLAALQAPIQIRDDLKLLSELSQHQVRWDSAMCNELKLPEGYHSVAVLLVKWREDDFGKGASQREVSDLEAVFRDDFNYHTKVIDLSNECICAKECNCSPQTRFDRSVHRFMEKWDGEHNLVIVYYTGHGTYRNKCDRFAAHLRLHATEDSEKPYVLWDLVEQDFVQSAKGDVLTIMDACYAGNVSTHIHRAYENTYEYLAASPKGRPTSRPGFRSFTSALISSLKHLLHRQSRHAFTTADLVQTIADQEWRQNCPPCFAPRGALVDRRILLAPQKPMETRYFENTTIPAYLTIRIELKDDGLNSDQVEELSRKVAQAVQSSKTRTRRIDWVSLAPRKSRSFRSVARSLAWISTSGKPRKNTLQTVSEEPANDENPIHKPGIWATFGIFTPRKHFHSVTVSLERPWTRVAATIATVAILVVGYSHRRRVSPLTLLYVLLRKT